MRKSCRVMITGAGSGVGQAVMKALRISGLPVTIIAADISPMNVALYRADEALIIPRVEESGALEEIIGLLALNRIDVVMIGSEFDLSFFARHKQAIEQQTGVRIIVAPLATVEMADDKWLTAEFLRINGLPFPESFVPDSVEQARDVVVQWGFPVILKTRRGTSSRHVHLIKMESELAEHFRTTPQPLLQRVIEIPSEELGAEYTCSIFKSMDGQIVGPFTARRTIRGGTSWHIEVAQFEQLNGALLAIANAVEFQGSLNVQLMLSSEGAIPFELNARFSGTTAVRAHFGFNEPAMSLLSHFYGEEIREPAIRSGVAMRYHEEVFIDGVNASSLRPGANNGTVEQWF